MIAAWAPTYLGIPYVLDGRSLRGCDCWGLVCLVHARELGNELPLYEGVCDRAHPSTAPQVEGELASGRWTAVDLDAARTGDVVGLWVRRPADLSHVGVVVGDGRMLNLHRGPRGASIEPYTRGIWADRVKGCWRYAA